MSAKPVKLRGNARTYILYVVEEGREDIAPHVTEGGGELSWVGAGAAALGLAGRADLVALENLLRGFDPSGQRKLLRNAGRPTRVLGWEIGVSPPKTVSVLFAAGDARVRKEILDAHDEGVAAVVQALEARGLFVRTGRGGTSFHPALFVGARATHLENRNGEPQIHDHLVMVNLGVHADGTGRVGAVFSKPAFNMQRELNAVYCLKVAGRLQRRLGVEIKKTPYSFEIKGVPKSLCDAMSSRRKEVVAALAASGRSGPAAAARAARRTRSPKQLLPPAERDQRWQAIARQHGFDPQSVLNRARAIPSPTPRREERQIAAAARAEAKRLAAERGGFSRTQLIERTAHSLIGSGVRAERVAEVITGPGRERSRIGLVPCGTERGVERFTSEAQRKQENALASNLLALAESRCRAVKERAVEASLSRGEFSAEQRAAVQAVARSERRLALVDGVAGSGKSRALWGVARACETAGHRVIGVAPTGVAADELGRSAGVQSRTVAKLLQDLQKPPLVATARRLLRQTDYSSVNPFLKALSKARRRSDRLTRKTVVILDEASQASTQDLHRLTRAVRKSGARLVMVGDSRQQSPVGEGGGYEYALQRFPHLKSSLEEVRRQRRDHERGVVKSLAAGDAQAAIDTLRGARQLHVAKDRAKARAALIDCFAKSGGLHDPRSHLILTPTNAERRFFNAVVQETRRRHGLLGKRAAKVRPGVRLLTGDRVVFKQNSHRLQVRNGQFGTVLKVGLTRRAVLVATDRGQVVKVPLAKYRKLDLGYSTTFFSAQSVTTPHAYALLGGNATHRASAYVALSRASNLTMAFAGERDAGLAPHKNLAKLMAHDRTKHLASVSGTRDRAADLARRGREMTR